MWATCRRKAAASATVAHKARRRRRRPYATGGDRRAQGAAILNGRFLMIEGAASTFGDARDRARRPASATVPRSGTGGDNAGAAFAGVGIVGGFHKG